MQHTLRQIRYLQHNSTRRARRELSVKQQPDGMSKLFGLLDPIASARVETALDTEASIVTKVDWAVIGDLHEVIPAIIEEIRSRG